MVSISSPDRENQPGKKAGAAVESEVISKFLRMFPPLPGTRKRHAVPLITSQVPWLDLSVLTHVNRYALTDVRI